MLLLTTIRLVQPHTALSTIYFHCLSPSHISYSITLHLQQPRTASGRASTQHLQLKLEADFYSTLLNFIKSGGGRTSSRSERIPQQDRLCLETCAIPSAHSFIYCVCVQFKHVSTHQYANNFTCHLTFHIVNASHAGSFWVPHKMKEQGEQLLDQIMSASHAVQGPNSSCEQHKKL